MRVKMPSPEFHEREREKHEVSQERVHAASGAPCSELLSHLDHISHTNGHAKAPARPPAVPYPCCAGRVNTGVHVELTDAG